MMSLSSAEAAQSRIFQTVKPTCIVISKLVLQAHVDSRANASLTTALLSLTSTLQNTTTELKEPLSKGLGDYIFFPLSHVFSQPQKFTDRVRELSLICVKLLVKSCWGAPGADFDGDLAKQLMIMVTFVVGGKPGSQGTTPSGASEETKIAGCSCLREIFSSLSAVQKSKRAWMIDATNIPAVGHCVTTLLDEVVSSTNTTLQISATEALEILVVDCVDDEDIRASFFPGTVSQLCKSLDPRTSGKRLSKPLAAGVKLLGRIVAAVLGDEKTKELGEKEVTAGSIDGRKGEFNVSQRSASWLRATSSQVSVALAGVLRLRTQRQVLVRRSVFQLCLCLVRECFVSLESSMMTLIETMVLLAADKDEELAANCASSLRSVASSKEGFGEILLSSLHGWITSFPRLMTSQDDDSKTRVLQEISISFKVLDELGVNSDVLQDQLSRNLSDAVSGLVSSTAEKRVELASTDIAPSSLDLIPVEPTTSTETQIGSFDSVILAEASQAQVAKAMSEVQQMLGRSSSAFPIIQRHVREAARGDTVNQCTSLWIATNVLRSSMEDEDDWIVDPNKVAMQKQLLEELCSVALTNLLKTYDNASTVNSSSSSALSTCVALEAVSFAAEKMKADFRIELVDALYPVVHLLGSRDAGVQTHAMICLNNIAVSCGYPSTRELLIENVDYLVNAVSLKLNVFDISPQAPTVLLMMIRLAGPSLIPYLDDIVASIFAALDNFHGYAKLTELLFAVLTGIVEESARDGKREFLITDGSETQRQEDEDDVKRSKLPTIEDLLEELEQRKVRSQSSQLPENTYEEDSNVDTSFPKKPWGPSKQKDKSILDDDDEDEDEAGEQSPTTAKNEPTTTPTYRTIKSIAKLSQHYLTHPSTTLRSLILGLVSTASPLLAVHKGSFLPLVNELWPVIVDRLSDTNDTIVISALLAISSLCRNAKTFMSSRINEVWPTLRSTFIAAKRKLNAEATRKTQRSNNSSKEIVKKGGGGASYTPHYQIWKASLQLFDDILRYTVLEDEKFDNLLEVVADDVFIGSRTDDEQNILASLEEALAMVSSDAVWLERTRRDASLGLLRDDHFKTPGPGFEAVVF